MTAPSFNYFYRVEITAIRLGDQIQSGTQTIRTKVTKTYNFVSKSLRDATTPSDRETMIPILEQVGEVTLNAGEFLPSTSFSSISISNHRGSFGADRRFSDILDRYTVVNQPITFYVGQSDNFTDMPSSWQQIASGQILSWNMSLNSDRPVLDFQIAPYRISDRVMNLEISRDIAGMENAPDSTIGQALPVVFNKIHNTQALPLSSYPQVIPLRISADGAETGKYALCTLMYQKTKARVMTNYYAKKAWETDADLWSEIDFTRLPDSYLGATASFAGLNVYPAIAYRIPEHAAGSNATGFIATGVTFTARGGGSVSRQSTAKLRAFILRVDRDTYDVIDEIVGGSAFLATYDAQNNSAGSTFNINISFSQPVVLDLMADRDYDFYIGYEVTNWAAGDMSLYMAGTATRALAQSANFTSGTSSDSTDDWRIILPAPSTIVAHRLRVVTATSTAHEDTYSKDGYTYASMTLSQPAPDSGQTNPALDSLSLVGLVEGFCDYTTNNRLLGAHDILSRLSLEWDGEKWNDVNAVDLTTLASSHYTPLLTTGGTHRGRYLTGISEGKVSYSQLITEVARGSASKIGIFSSKKLFLYPWGVTVSPAFNIPQADIIPLSWEVRDPSNIINRTAVTFDKVFAIEEGLDREDGYAYSIDFSNPSYLPVQQITEESRNLYGVQNIVENKFSIFGYSDYYSNIGTPGYLTGGPSSSQPQEGGVVTFSVDFLAEYYMTRFALPAAYCSFVVPWHRYKDIKMFDVINFAHSEFPAFYGTDPSARPGVVISGSNTTPVPNAGYGQELTRAQTYRGLVEGISYVMAMEHAPAIRLTVLVLLNREFDPT